MAVILLPLSQTGEPAAFAAAVEAHRAAVEAHRLGPAGEPVPATSALIEALVVAISDTGPVASRKPDRFEVLPYEIFDDTPKTPEVENTLAVLRETIIPGYPGGLPLRPEETQDGP